MSESLQLHGYRYCVYTRVALMAVHKKSLDYVSMEINPFLPDVSLEYRRMHPFTRVPVHCHGEFVIYETAAITRYLDAAFTEPALMPDEPRTLARVAQVIGIVDNYGYWPMARQVFSHADFVRSKARHPVSLRSIQGCRPAAAFCQHWRT